MRNIKLTIEYDGSRYQGWTRLGKDESGNTISNKITEVLKKKMIWNFSADAVPKSAYMLMRRLPTSGHPVLSAPRTSSTI